MFSKKFFFVLIWIFFLLLGIVFPLLLVERATALEKGDPCDGDCGGAGLSCFCEPKPGGTEKDGVCLPSGAIIFCPPSKQKDILKLAEEIMNWIFYITIVVAPLMIAIGAFLFMTSTGEPKMAQRARSIIIWSLVGLAIVLFGKGIISIIKALLMG